MSQSHLFFGNSCNQCQLFINQIRCEYRVRFFHSIGSSQIIIFACVYNNPCKSVDYARHKLVNQCSLHIYIPEKNAIKCIVEHYIKTFECANGSYFGHTQSGAVIAQANVTTCLLSHFVKRPAHDAEIFLRGKSSSKTFGGSSERNVIQ